MRRRRAPGGQIGGGKAISRGTAPCPLRPSPFPFCSPACTRICTRSHSPTASIALPTSPILFPFPFLSFLLLFLFLFLFLFLSLSFLFLGFLYTLRSDIFSRSLCTSDLCLLSILLLLSSLPLLSLSLS